MYINLENGISSESSIQKEANAFIDSLTAGVKKIILPATQKGKEIGATLGKASDTVVNSAFTKENSPVFHTILSDAGEPLGKVYGAAGGAAVGTIKNLAHAMNPNNYKVDITKLPKTNLPKEEIAAMSDSVVPEVLKSASIEKTALRKLLKVRGLKGRAPLNEKNIETFTKNRNRGISSIPEKRDAFENTWVKETDDKARKMREFAKKNEGKFEYTSREDAQNSNAIGKQNTQEKSTQNRNIVKSYNDEFKTNKRYYTNNPEKRQQDLKDLKDRLHKQASIKLAKDNLKQYPLNSLNDLEQYMDPIGEQQEMPGYMSKEHGQLNSIGRQIGTGILAGVGAAMLGKGYRNRGKVINAAKTLLKELKPKAKPGSVIVETGPFNDVALSTKFAPKANPAEGYGWGTKGFLAGVAAQSGKDAYDAEKYLDPEAKVAPVVSAGLAAAAPFLAKKMLTTSPDNNMFSHIAAGTAAASILPGISKGMAKDQQRIDDKVNRELLYNMGVRNSNRERLGLDPVEHWIKKNSDENENFKI